MHETVFKKSAQAFSGACPILVLFFFFSLGFPQQIFQITQQTQTTPMKKPNPAAIPTIICGSMVSGGGQGQGQEQGQGQGQDG